MWRKFNSESQRTNSDSGHRFDGKFDSLLRLDISQFADYLKHRAGSMLEKLLQGVRSDHQADITSVIDLPDDWKTHFNCLNLQTIAYNNLRNVQRYSVEFNAFFVQKCSVSIRADPESRTLSLILSAKKGRAANWSLAVWLP